MRLTKALPLLAVHALLAASCLADVEDGTVGDAGFLGVRWYTPGPEKPSTIRQRLAEWAKQHTGPCASACVTCAEAHAASTEGLPGLSSCWRDCEGLK